MFCFTNLNDALIVLKRKIAGQKKEFVINNRKVRILIVLLLFLCFLQLDEAILHFLQKIY
jgi:hypothetical protein